MLFMIVEHFRGNAAPVYQRFRERGRLAPDGLRYVNSWVTLDMERCYQVMECEDRRLLDEWMGQWSDLVDFEVIPVLSSAEAAAMALPREAPVEIVPYDPAWPDQFAAEAEILRRALAEWIAGPIEHIGSTAIPGLAAKPVIDIMLGVESLEASRPAIAAAAELGYCYAPYQADVEHWFCKPSFAFRTHHLHLIPAGTPQWKRPIAFRNYLRDHADVAAEYEALKRRLAVEHRADREAYTAAKRPFIDRVTERALARPIE
jgi:GrpB-like predicted nucleotidyltransferase (UPF0157 family)